MTSLFLNREPKQRKTINNIRNFKKISISNQRKTIKNILIFFQITFLFLMLFIVFLCIGSLFRNKEVLFFRFLMFFIVILCLASFLEIEKFFPNFLCSFFFFV